MVALKTLILKEIGDYATSLVYTDLLSATPGKRSIT